MARIHTRKQRNTSLFSPSVVLFSRQSQSQNASAFFFFFALYFSIRIGLSQRQRKQRYKKKAHAGMERLPANAKASICRNYCCHRSPHTPPFTASLLRFHSSWSAVGPAIAVLTTHQADVSTISAFEHPGLQLEPDGRLAVELLVVRPKTTLSRLHLSGDHHGKLGDIGNAPPEVHEICVNNCLYICPAADT